MSESMELPSDIDEPQVVNIDSDGYEYSVKIDGKHTGYVNSLEKALEWVNNSAENYVTSNIDSDFHYWRTEVLNDEVRIFRYPRNYPVAYDSLVCTFGFEYVDCRE